MIYVIPMYFDIKMKERWSVIYRGSYMSAHVLLNLLNELGKSNKFNKVNNTGA